jgi:hypothetical protein
LGIRLRRALVAIAVGAMALSIPVVSSAPAGAFTGTAQAKVFEPNPVVTLQDESLTDQKDADYAALQPAYEMVTRRTLTGAGTYAATTRRCAVPRVVRSVRTRAICSGAITPGSSR